VARYIVVDCLLEQMAKREPDRNRIEVLQGTLDMMILRTLKWGTQHGHGIGQTLRARSENALQVEHGSLYPALHRLEGAVRSQPAREILPAHHGGKAATFERAVEREEVVRTIARVMRPAEEA